MTHFADLDRFRRLHPSGDGGDTIGGDGGRGERARDDEKD